MIGTDRIPIARPPFDVAESLAAIAPCFESGWITMGPAVAEFEAAIAEIVGASTVACSSCTAGIHLALLAWEIGPGDEVIVPACSFVASAHAVAQTGATPVFCDVDPATGQLDPASAAAMVGPRTRAIMPVHLYGIPAPMDAINALATLNGLKVIEDAACALGASYNGVPCGALGDAASFSFHPRKVVTTGEGGALTSFDEELLSQARAQRNHGAQMSGYDRFSARQGMLPSFDLLGFNYRMTDLQARVGLPQLARLDQIVDERRAHAAHYDAVLADLEGLIPLAVPDGGRACYQSYILRVTEAAPATPAELLDHLDGRGIQAVQGAQLLPDLGYYRESSGYRPGSFPGAEHLAERSLAIPLYAGLTEPERARVVDSIRELWS
jgi:dTDP-4-amino-4,6-dideoxygalactose transaminase